MSTGVQNDTPNFVGKIGDCQSVHSVSNGVLEVDALWSVQLVQLTEQRTDLSVFRRRVDQPSGSIHQRLDPLYKVGRNAGRGRSTMIQTRKNEVFYQRPKYGSGPVNGKSVDRQTVNDAEG